MGAEELGFLVTLHRFESVSLFFGCRVDYEAKDQLFQEHCSYIALAQYQLEPDKDMVVGVRSKKRNKWVRARIENTYLRSNKVEYKVHLVDYGGYETVTKQQMIVLNELAKYPFQCLIIGLEGVLPTVTLSREHKEYLQDIFKQGQIYFKLKSKICNIKVGDIFIKPNDKTPTINLKHLLLDEHLVKVTHNFGDDLKKFYRAFDWFEESSCTPSKEDVVMNHQKKELKENEVTVDDNDESQVVDKSGSSSYAGTSTGYSSSEELNELLLAPENAVFVPAGYQVPEVKKPRYKRAQEVKKIQTYYQRRAELQRSRSLNRGKDKSEGTDGPQRSRSTHRSGVGEGEAYSKHRSRDEREPSRSQSKHTSGCHLSESNRDKITSSPKCVRWGDNTYEEDTLSTDKQQSQRASRVFNLNFKMEENKQRLVEDTHENLASGTIQQTSIVPDSRKTLCPSNVVSSAQSSTANSLTNTCNSVLSDSAESTISNQSCSKISKKRKLLKLKYKTEETVSQTINLEPHSKVDNGDHNIIKTISESKPKDSLDTERASNSLCDLNITNISSNCSSSNTSMSVNISDSVSQAASLSANSSSNSSLNTSGLSKKKRVQLKHKEELAKLQVNSTGFQSEPNDKVNSNAALVKKKLNQVGFETVNNTVPNVTLNTTNMSVINLQSPNSSYVNSNRLPEISKTSSINISERSHESLKKSQESQDSTSSKANPGSSKLSKKQILRLKYKSQLSELKDSETRNLSGTEISENQVGKITNKQQNCSVANPGKLHEQTFKVKTPALLTASKEDLNDDLYERQKKINALMAPTEEERRRAKAPTSSSRISTDSSDPVIQKMNACSVLVHSKSEGIVRPITRLSESALHHSILQSMEKMYRRELGRLHWVSFPTISAKHNVVMISPARSGKTLGYVVPLASNLLDPEYHLKLRTGNGPLAIVIAPSWRSAEYAAMMFRELTKVVDVVLTYGGGAEMERKVDLLNGCHVLVSTPMCLVRLLEAGVTNLKRLYHFVMDDADVLFEKYKTEMEKLMVLVDAMQQDRERAGVTVPLQVVMAATQWTNPVKELTTRILVDPTLCITSALEACVYAGIKPVVTFIKNDKKTEKLVEILKEIEGKKRVVVMCKSKTDVQNVHRLLVDMGMGYVLAAHEDLSSVNISEIPNFWNKNECDANTLWEQCTVFLPILVRSDAVLEEVPISNAEVLIHYNMPETLKTFSLRFTCLLGNYPNLLKQDKKCNKCEVHILMDEENDLEVPGVMEFMKRLGTKLTKSVEETLEKIDWMKQMKKIEEPLCEDVKQFGKCWDAKRCPSRHIISAQHDLPQDIPQSGYVKIIVQFVHNACHFSARLLEHSENGIDWQKLSTDMMWFSLKINNYYSLNRNRKLHGIPSVGDMVAIESLDVFQRAVVMKITRNNKLNEPEAVNLRLIDCGDYEYNYSVMRLYNLPEDMKAVPPGAVDIYLCNLLPKDLDTSWNKATKCWVERVLREAKRESPNGYLRGKILLSLGRSIWLDPVEYLEYLPEVNTTVFKFSLRQDLLRNNNAFENLDHISSLRQLCKNGGITLKEEEKPQPKKRAQVKPDWAWLPQETCEINILALQAPDVLLVRINKFYDCLTSLVKEIQTFAGKVEKCDSIKLLDVGDICLGRTPDFEEWNRALITKKPSEEQVELLFVDYGDFATVAWSDVAPISNQLITKLPFQIIECFLAGVEFKKVEDKDNWEEEVIDQIAEFTRDSEGATLTLQAKVCGVEPVGTISKGKRYKIILHDFTENETINKKLISSGIAQSLVQDAHLLENCKVPDNEKRNDLSDDVEVVTTLQKRDKCEVLFPDEFDLNEKIAADEKEQRILKLLQDIDNDKFDISTFHDLEEEDDPENDADISGNSEGSVQSLPQSRGTLPLDKCIKCNLNNENHCEVHSSSSSSSQVLSSSSRHESLLSLDECREEKCEILNKDYISARSFSLTDQISPEKSLRCNIAVQSEHFSDLFIANDSNISTSLPRTPLSININKEERASSFFNRAQSTPKSHPIHDFSFNNSPTTGRLSIKIPSSLASCPDLISPTQQLSNSCKTPRLNLVDKVRPFLQHVSIPSLEVSFMKDKLEEQDSSSSASSSSNKTLVTDQCSPTRAFEHKESLTVKNENITQYQFQSEYVDNKNISMSGDRENNETSQKWVQSVLSTDSEGERVEVNSLCEVDKPENNQEFTSTNVAFYNELDDSEIRKPMVQWHQNDIFVWIEIKLPEVSDYKFNSTITSVHFRAMYNNILYGFSLDLYGGHKTETLQASPKAFHFEVRLEKLLKGKKYFWPRLTESEGKLPWLKLNVEKAFKDIEDSEDEDLVRLPPLRSDTPTETEVSDSLSVINSELSITDW